MLMNWMEGDEEEYRAGAADEDMVVEWWMATKEPDFT